MEKGSTMHEKPITLLLFASAIVLGCGVPLAQSAAADPSVAYAHVRGDGTLDTVNSQKVVAIDGSNGLYCFKLAFKPKNAVATLAADPTAPNQGLGFISVAVPPTLSFTCPKIE
jgi:hypothetical protein